MMLAHPDIFTPPDTRTAAAVEPWRPRPLSHDQWPPPYPRIHAWRIKTLQTLRSDPSALASAHASYSTRPVEFINHWIDTFNPRKLTDKWMPFVFFERQADLVEFLEYIQREGESGLIEKSRDMGATWVACAYSVWRLKYTHDDAIGWGSRKQDLVDKLGDADSIFEKMRLIIRRLPPEFRPDWSTALMKIINNDNGAIIAGESGDNIGRGGRKATYFKDEAAHYERPELIEAALGDNTNVQVDISSVNGLGNVFHRRRESGEEWYPGAKLTPGIPRVFIMDWRHHPEKDQDWYDKRKAKAEREGLQHLFAQEVDRNYSAAVENTIIQYEWITAAVDAHLEIPQMAAMVDAENDDWMAGLDVYDAGADKNALAVRQGFVLRHARDWGERDPGVATRNVLGDLRERNLRGIKLQYDPIGIGSAVKSEWNRLVETGAVEWDEIELVPWHAGAAVIRPYERLIPGDEQTMLNRDMFHNFKAQAWWSVRTRFYKTWRLRQKIREGRNDETYTAAELVSLDSRIECLPQLMKELAQPTAGRSTQTLKMLVEKSPNGARSPNLGDATVQVFFPASRRGGSVEIGSYSG